MSLWFLIPEGGRCKVGSMNSSIPGRFLLQMLFQICLLMWGLMDRMVMLGWIRRMRVKMCLGDLLVIMSKELFLVQVMLEVLEVANMVAMVLVKLDWTKGNRLWWSRRTLGVSLLGLKWLTFGLVREVLV